MTFIKDNDIQEAATPYHRPGSLLFPERPFSPLVESPSLLLCAEIICCPQRGLTVLPGHALTMRLGEGAEKPQVGQPVNSRVRMGTKTSLTPERQHSIPWVLVLLCVSAPESFHVGNLQHGRHVLCP